jgi:DNA-binding transcriptional LysR family regulator
VDIRNIRQILAIKQHGSFAKAAVALGVSQPSLSKSVARLEDELKAPIFVRTASGSELTPLGEVIVERGLRVIQETQSLIQASELVAGGESGQIRLGIGLALRRTFAPKLIQEIADRHPNLDLMLEIGDRYQLLPALNERRLDIVFCVLDPHLVASGHEITQLISTFAVALAAPSHPLAAERKISRARFAQFRTAGARNAAFTVDAVLGTTPAQRSGSSYSSNDWELLLPLVQSGRSTLLLPAVEAAPLVQSGMLCELDMDIGLTVNFVAMATRAAAASPLVRKIVGYASAIGSQLEGAQEAMRPGRSLRQVPYAGIIAIAGPTTSV